MPLPAYIQQLIDQGIAHYDMDGCVVMNPAFTGGGTGMPNINIQIHNHNHNHNDTYNTYNTYTYNFYGDHATNNDIHENRQAICHL